MSQGGCPPRHHYHRAKKLASKPSSFHRNRLECNKLYFTASLSQFSFETSSEIISSQVQCQWLRRGTSPTARKKISPRLCCSSFHQGETCQTNDLTFSGIHRCWGFRYIQTDLLCADSSPWSTIMDYPRLPAKKVAKCWCLSCRWKDEGDRRLELVLLQI